jgi:hypothetical protein
VDADLGARPPEAVDDPGGHVGTVIVDSSRYTKYRRVDVQRSPIATQRGGSSVREATAWRLCGSRLQQTFALESYMVIHVGRGKVSSQPYAEA